MGMKSSAVYPLHRSMCHEEKKRKSCISRIAGARLEHERKRNREVEKWDIIYVRNRSFRAVVSDDVQRSEKNRQIMLRKKPEVNREIR